MPEISQFRYLLLDETTDMASYIVRLKLIQMLVVIDYYTFHVDRGILVRDRTGTDLTLQETSTPWIIRCVNVQDSHTVGSIAVNDKVIRIVLCLGTHGCLC